MKRVKPEDIRIGEFYIQNWDKCKVLKKRTKYESDRITGIVLKVFKITGIYSEFIGINWIGHINYKDRNKVRWYKLSQEEAFKELI